MSGAEYEGEHCTQVLVRPQTPAVDVEPPLLVEPVFTDTESKQPIPAPPSPTEPPFRIDAVDIVHRGTRSQTPRPGAILVIEIDDFDGMQADFGMHRAEAAVHQLSDVLTSELGGAQLARIANHRFAVAALGASEAGGDVLAERLRETIEAALLEVDGKTVRRTITIGAAAMGASSTVADALNVAFRTLLCGARRTARRTTFSGRALRRSKPKATPTA